MNLSRSRGRQKQNLITDAEKFMLGKGEFGDRL